MSGGVSGFFRTLGTNLSSIRQSIKTKFRELKGGDKKASEIAPQTISEKNNEWVRATPRKMDTYSTAKGLSPKLEPHAQKTEHVSEEKQIAKKTIVMGGGHKFGTELNITARERQFEKETKNLQNLIKKEVDSNSKIEKTVIENIDKYVSIMKKLIDLNPTKAHELLCSSLKTADSKKTIDPLVSKLFASGITKMQSAELVKYVTKRQILEGNENKGNLLRSNTLASKSLTEFANKYVLPELRKSFSDIASSVSIYDRGIDQKLQNAKGDLDKKFFENSANQQNQALTDFVEECFARCEKFKIEDKSGSFEIFNEICGSIKEVIANRFDQKTANVVSDNLFILRVFNPLISTLGTDKNLKLEKGQQDMCIYAGKLMQKFSNGLKFEEKDGVLMGLNPWIEKNLNK